MPHADVTEGPSPPLPGRPPPRAAPAWMRWAAAEYAVALAAIWLLAFTDRWDLAGRILPPSVVLGGLLLAAVLAADRRGPARAADDAGKPRAHAPAPAAHREPGKPIDHGAPCPRWAVGALLAGAVAAGWALRLLANGDHPVPLGYDYGFYKATFDLNEGQVPLDRMPAWSRLQMEPGLSALHAVLHGVAGLGAHEHLADLFPLLAAFLAVPAFVAARDRFGTMAGLGAAWLTALSATQFEAFAYLYEKNLLALGLLAVLLALLHHRAWAASGIVLGALAVWHRPTFLLTLLATPVAVFPHLRREWRGVAVAAGIAAALALPVWLALPDVFFGVGGDVAGEAAISSPDQPASSGTFFPLREYLVRAAAYLPLALGAVALAWRFPHARVPVALLALSLLYVVLRFPLHLRFIVMLDATACLLAIAALARLLPTAGTRPPGSAPGERGTVAGPAGPGPRGRAPEAALPGTGGATASRRWLVPAVACALVALAAVPAIAQAIEPTTEHRWVTPSQHDAIVWTRTLPADAVLVADNLRAPYVIAGSGHTTFGPGLFDDPHDRGDWGRFWAGLNATEARDFLGVYGDDVYVLQVLGPGPDWGEATLRGPGFEQVHATPDLAVWHLVPEDA